MEHGTEFDWRKQFFIVEDQQQREAIHGLVMSLSGNTPKPGASQSRRFAFPGLLPVSVNAKGLEALFKGSQGDSTGPTAYRVSRKLDGERFLTVSQKGAGWHFVNRRGQVYRAPTFGSKLLNDLDYLLFDVEVVKYPKIWLVIVFDVLYWHENCVVSWLLHERMNLVSGLPLDTNISKEGKVPSLALCRKQYYNISEHLLQLVEEMSAVGQAGACDGLIFTPCQEYSPEKKVFKWKPPELTTFDFYLRATDEANSRRLPFIDPVTQKPVDVGAKKWSLCCEEKDAVYAEIHARDQSEGYQDFNTLKDKLVECRQRADGHWEICKVRTDKDRANYKTVVAKTSRVTAEEVKGIYKIAFARAPPPLTLEGYSETNFASQNGFGYSEPHSQGHQYHSQWAYQYQYPQYSTPSQGSYPPATEGPYPPLQQYAGPPPHDQQYYYPPPHIAPYPNQGSPRGEPHGNVHSPVQHHTHNGPPSVHGTPAPGPLGPVLHGPAPFGPLHHPPHPAPPPAQQPTAHGAPNTISNTNTHSSAPHSHGPHLNNNKAPHNNVPHSASPLSPHNASPPHAHIGAPHVQVHNPHPYPQQHTPAAHHARDGYHSAPQGHYMNDPQYPPPPNYNTSPGQYKPHPTPLSANELRSGFGTATQPKTVADTPPIVHPTPQTIHYPNGPPPRGQPANRGPPPQPVEVPHDYRHDHNPPQPSHGSGGGRRGRSGRGGRGYAKGGERGGIRAEDRGGDSGNRGGDRSGDRGDRNGGRAGDRGGDRGDRAPGRGGEGRGHTEGHYHHADAPYSSQAHGPQPGRTHRHSARGRSSPS